MVNSRRRPRRPAAGRPHPRATGDGRGHSDGRVSICKMPSGPLLAHPLRGRHPGVGAQGRHRRRPEGHRGAAALGHHRPAAAPSATIVTTRDLQPHVAARLDMPGRHVPTATRSPICPRLRAAMPKCALRGNGSKPRRRGPTAARRLRPDASASTGTCAAPGRAGRYPNTARVTVSSSAGRGPLRVGSPPDQAGIPSPTSARRLRPMAGRRRPRTCPSAGRRAVSRPTYSEIGRMTSGSGLAGGNRRARARRCQPRDRFVGAKRVIAPWTRAVISLYRACARRRGRLRYPLDRRCLATSDPPIDVVADTGGL